MSDSVQPHRRQPTRLPSPRDSPGRNTGVSCHFLLHFHTAGRFFTVRASRDVSTAIRTTLSPILLPSIFLEGSIPSKYPPHPTPSQSGFQGPAPTRNEQKKPVPERADARGNIPGSLRKQRSKDEEETSGLEDVYLHTVEPHHPTGTSEHFLPWCFHTDLSSESCSSEGGVLGPVCRSHQSKTVICLGFIHLGAPTPSWLLLPHTHSKAGAVGNQTFHLEVSVCMIGTWTFKEELRLFSFFLPLPF